MEFAILGNLEVRAGGRLLDLGGAVQRRMLAALLLSPNRVVAVDRLVEVGWDGPPPATAERQVRNRVAALRAILTRHGGFIDTADSGYRIRVEPGALDSLVFEDLVARGRSAEALRLWRGRPFPGLGDALGRDAAAWEDRWLGVVEECQQPPPLDELVVLVAAHPLRERLVGRLMTVLVAADRRADALLVYSDLAGRLADRLGIDPSPELRRLRDSVENPAVARTGPTPQQLPGNVAGFTGRVGDLNRLDRLLSDGQATRAVVISAIAGTAGVGKTALAVHWGHRVRDKFPDGQLYVNLRGYAQAAPVRPVDALGGFLRALGVPAEKVPVEVDDAAALYRDQLADRQLLIVLDNAVDAEQVRPLLPASAGCLTVVTSRLELAGLPAVQIPLEVLDPGEAIELLARILGEDRVAAEPAAVAELAGLCAYLPLALRIAAANLIDQPDVAGYVSQLRAGNRLAELAVDGDPTAAVRGAFALSYARLGEPAQRMFRLLGLGAGPDIDALAAASLAAVPVAEATALLDELNRAHLVERHGDRHAFHDLLKLYARELADREPDRDAAAGRLFDHYVHAASAVDLILAPGRIRLPIDPPAAGVVAVPVADRAAAAAWSEAERAVVVAAVEQAYEIGADQRAQQLAAMTELHFSTYGFWPERYAITRVALAAAERSGYRLGLAVAHQALGGAMIRLGQIDGGIGQLHLSLDVYEAIGDRIGVANALRNLATVYTEHRDLGAALALAERSYEVCVELGNPQRTGRTLNQIALIRSRGGDNEGALADARAALDMLADTPFTDLLTPVWSTIGETLDHLGRHDEALECYQRTLEINEATGNRRNLAVMHEKLGDHHHLVGRLDVARESWRTALATYEELGAREEAIDLRAKMIGS